MPEVRHLIQAGIQSHGLGRLGVVAGPAQTVRRTAGLASGRGLHVTADAVLMINVLVLRGLVVFLRLKARESLPFSTKWQASQVFFSLISASVCLSWKKDTGGSSSFP